MVKRFLIYGILGWGIEIFWTGIGSLLDGDLRLMGYSNLWMFFIYGFAVFLEPIHHAIIHWHWYIRGMLWILMIWFIEYSSGWLLYRILGVYPWHYADRFAINGLITISYAPAWFIAGMLFEWVHMTMDRYRIT